MTSRIARFADQMILIGLIAFIPTILVPNKAFAQTDLSTSNIAALVQKNSTTVFEIKNVQVLNLFAEKTAPEVTDEPKTNPDIQVLQGYLEKKGSPLAPYAEHILKQENWKLVLAISNGESTLCKKQLYNNCWGVGGAWNLRRYASFAEGFSDVNRLLGEKYIPNGGNTPEKIVNKYVGHPNANWVLAVNRILAEVNQLPLQATNLN